MKLLFDFFPIILFFIGYYEAPFFINHTFIGEWLNPKRGDLINATIIATALAIIGSFIQVGYSLLKYRKVEKVLLFSAGLITVLGGITIAFGNPAFVQWKPTVINWMFAVVFFVSIFVGEKTLVERLMGSQLELPTSIWNRLNISWIVFFLFSGAANLYVAFYYHIDRTAKARMDTWVDFHSIGLTALTLIFVVLQAVYLMWCFKTLDEEEADDNDKTETS